MKAEILDSLNEGEKTCYLIRVHLDKYLDALPDNYDEYEIQREIVNNIYLDRLVNTIVDRKHIPLIVLIAEEVKEDSDLKEVEFKDFNILDGLQRTYRLNAIYKTHNYLKENKDLSLLLPKAQLVKQFKHAIKEFNSDTNTLINLASYLSTAKETDESLFKRYQWFELWTGLTKEDQVEKMLVLNAGHKSMSGRHQIELLFANIIPKLNEVEEGFELVREKNKKSAEYSKSRRKGQYHFAHIVTSFLSFIEGKALTTNVNLIQKAQNDHFSTKSLDEMLNVEFLTLFIKFLKSLDDHSFQEFGDIGVKWVGRETSLVGMFGALGKYANEKEIKPIIALERLHQLINSNIKCLRLDEYEDERNSLDLASVNIGNVNKRAVFEGIYSLLVGEIESIDWEMFFKRKRA